MVSKLFLPLLLACLICSGRAVAEPQLTVKVDKKSSVLGEPLLLEIKANDMRTPLSGMNLDKLKQDFNVYSINSNVQTQQKNGHTVKSETMALTLYPLRTGRLLLPVFKFYGSSSKSLEITVAESGKQTPRVIFKTAMDTLHPNVRQAVTLTLDIYDDGSLQWNAPREIAATGAHLRKLAESQREEELDGIRYTVHHYAWALMPLREGRLTVEFPMMDAMKFGSRLRYAVAPLRVEAAAVPAYLPVYVPIGKVMLKPEPLPNEIALNRPVNWVFSVQGYGISEEGLGKVISVIHDNESVHFYPYKITNGGNDHPTTAVQTLQVTIPFVPLRTGTLQLPEINIPYYDTGYARVDSTLISASHVEVFNPLWHMLFMITLALMLLIGTTGLVYWLYKKLRLKLRRRKALLTIGHVASVTELQQALLNFENDGKQEKFLTLQQWLKYMQQRYELDERLAVTIDKLARAQYGTHTTNIAELIREAVQVLSKLVVKKEGQSSEQKNTLLQTLFYHNGTS